MSKSILLLHHVESMWNEPLSNFGTSVDQCIRNAIDYLLFSEEEIDEVILTRFEDADWEDEHSPLLDVCEHMGVPIRLEVYGYGFSRDPDEVEDALEIYPDNELGKTWCYGNRDYHSDADVLEIHDWHHDLKGAIVLLGGAFEGECLNDMEKILDTLDVDVKKLHELCVGTGVPYEPLAPRRLIDEMSHHQEALDDLADEIEKHLEALEANDLMGLAEDYPNVAEKHFDRYLEIMEAYNEEVDEKYNIDMPDMLLEYAPTSPYSELQEIYEALLEGEVSELENVICEGLANIQENEPEFSP